MACSAEDEGEAQGGEVLASASRERKREGQGTCDRVGVREKWVHTFRSESKQTKGENRRPEQRAERQLKSSRVGSNCHSSHDRLVAQHERWTGMDAVPRRRGLSVDC